MQKVAMGIFRQSWSHFQQGVHLIGLDFCQNLKNLIFGLFWAILGLNSQIWAKRDFFRKIGSLFYVYGPLTSQKKSDKTHDPISLTLRYGRTDGITDLRTSIYRTQSAKAGVQLFTFDEFLRLFLPNNALLIMHNYIIYA